MSRRDIEAVYVLTPTQQGMLFATLDQPNIGIYVEQASYRLAGDLETEALLAAWRRSIARHAALRTAFYWEGREQPLQVVVGHAELPVAALDWRDLDDEEQEAQLAELLDADRRQGFTLSEAPLMRLTLVWLADRSHQLIWSHHHLILDGWSVALLVREVLESYEAGRRGVEPPERPVPEHRAYVAWLARQDRDQAALAWRRALAGVTEATRLPPDPAADGADSVATTVLGEQHLDLDAALTDRLGTAARAAGVTVNTLLQAAIGLLLARYTGQRDVVFGFTVSGRPDDLPDMEHAIGLYVGTVPLRLRIDPRATVATLLAQVLGRAADAQAWGFCSLAEIQGWSEVPRDQPLVEVLLVFENYPRPSGSVGDLGLEPVSFRLYERTEYPLTLVAVPGESLRLTAVHDPTRSSAALARRLLGHLRNLLSGVAEDGQRSIASLPMLSPDEREAARSTKRPWNPPSSDSPSTIPEDRCLHQLFAGRAERSPDDVALQLGDRRVTYGALRSRVERLAARLRQRGARPETLVGVFFERSIELVVAVLGVLEAGAAYLPLDPRYPAERLAFMLDDSGARLVVTRDEIRDRLPPTEAPVVTLASLEAEPAREGSSGDDESSAARGATRAHPDHLAYVIYTSGSTGRPKGVMITHANVTRLFQVTEPLFAFGSADVWTLFHSAAFDFSVWELWGALLYGGRLVVVPWEDSRDPQRFRALLARQQVTVLNQTPSAFGQLIAADATAAADESLALRWVIFGGEALELASLRPWHACHGDRPALVNMYGITETTVHVTFRRLTPEGVAAGGRSVIGWPLSDLDLEIVDTEDRLLPPGIAGEALVGGAGVSRGYLGRPALTAERFLPDPRADRPGARRYRTGDRLRRDDEGDLDYLGRLDQQVQVRGFRVEPGEIEAALAAEPGVLQAAVVARDAQAGAGQTLDAFVVPEAPDSVASAALRSVLADRLPEHMVPSTVTVVAALPLTAHGKVDRRALSADGSGRGASVSEDLAIERSARTPVEAALCEIWRDVLAVAEVGPDADFFELGGHSLLATQLLSRVRRTFQVDLGMPALFARPTLGAMAEAVTGAGDEDGDEDDRSSWPPIVPQTRDQPLPLSFGQERLWLLDRLEPGNPIFNIACAVRLEGALETPALARAIACLIARHEPLRTTVVEEEGTPNQRIAAITEATAPILPLVDLGALPPSVAADAQERAAQALSRRGFDLSVGPLFRPALLRAGVGDHELVLAMHHVIADGWSMGLLARDLMALYRAGLAAAQGEPPPPSLPALPVHYADFAIWQKRCFTGERAAAELDHWHQGLGERLRPLPLPYDRPPPARPSFRGATVAVHLPAELVGGLAALGRRFHGTLFITLLAGFHALLARTTGEEDIVIGAPVAGRNRLETEHLIGLFINTLLLRADLRGDPSFRLLYDRLRPMVLRAFGHQDVPVEQVLTGLGAAPRSGRATPIQALLLWHNTPLPQMALPGLAVNARMLERKAAQADLVLELERRGEEIAGILTYRADRFTEQTGQTLVERYRGLLASIVEAPELPLSALPLASAREQMALDRSFTRDLEAW